MSFVSRSYEKFVSDNVISETNNQAEKTKAAQEKSSEAMDLILGTEKVFEEMEEALENKKIDRHELVDLFKYIFENSVDDATNLMVKIPLSQSEVLDCVSSPRFIFKHQRVVNMLQKKLEREDGNIVNEVDAEYLSNSIEHAREKIRENDYDELIVVSEDKALGEEALKIKKKLSKIYSQFLGSREVQEKSGQKISVAEKIAEMNLKKAETAFEENYYAGDILKSFFDMITNFDREEIERVAQLNFQEAEIKNRYQTFENYFKLLKLGQAPWKGPVLRYLENKKLDKNLLADLKFATTISREQLAKLESVMPEGVDSIRWQKLKKRSRYKVNPVSFAAENSIAKQGLTSEINKSLVGHFDSKVRVEKDKTSGEYKVKTENGTEMAEIESGVGLDIVLSEQQDQSNEPLHLGKSGDQKYFLNKRGLFYKDPSTGIVIKGREGIQQWNRKADRLNSSSDKIAFNFGDNLDRPDEVRYTNNSDLSDLEMVKNPDQALILDKGFVGDKLWFVQRLNSGKKRVILDSVEHNRYDVIQRIHDVDGSLVYFAARDGKKFMVIDGRELRYEGESDPNGADVFYFQKIDGKLYFQDEISDQNLKRDVVMTEKGDSFEVFYDNAYNLKTIGGKPCFEFSENIVDISVVWNGTRSRHTFNSIFNTKILEKDGKPCYIGERLTSTGKKDFFLVQGDDEIEKIDIEGEINNFNVTQDGKVVMNITDKNDLSFVYVDGVKEGYGEKFKDILISKDDYVYQSYDQDLKRFFVINGVPQEKYGALGIEGFIEDKFYYTAMKGSDFFLIVDGEEIGPCEEITEIEDNNSKTTGFRYQKKGSDEVHFIRPASQQNVLTIEESRKLEMLNLLENPDKDKIQDFFAESSGEGVENEFKRFLESVPTIAHNINKAIGKVPEIFMDMVSGKKDRLYQINANDIFGKAFTLYEKKGGDGYGGLERGWGATAGPTLEDVLRPGDVDSMEGGDPTPFNDFEIVKFREKPQDMVVENVYGRYDGQKNIWSKVDFEIDRNIIDPMQANTATLENLSGMDEVVLSYPLGAKLLTDRVKGITQNGEEIFLQPQLDVLGCARVKIGDHQIESLVYSFEESKAPTVIPNLSAKEYENFKKSFLRAGEKKASDTKNQVKNDREFLKEKTIDLPAEATLFLKSIEDLGPKQKVIEIEKFVRNLSYYDFDNKEVMPDKRDKNPSETLFIMERRMKELQSEEGAAGNESVKNKKYAGVCIDFNKTLTIGMLREAGFLAGLLGGYGAGHETVKISHAHGTAYVIWPSEGGNQIFKVDGTPSGLENISTPSLEEQDQEALEQIKKLKQEANKDLFEIKSILENQDIEKIAQITNGNLEKMLNLVIAHDTKVKHFKVIEHVLDSFFYTPFAKANFKHNPGLKTFLLNEVRKEKNLPMDFKKAQSLEEAAGTGVIDLINSFADRFIRHKLAKNKAESLEMLESIFDITNEELDHSEKLAVKVVVEYLKAKKMVK